MSTGEARLPKLRSIDVQTVVHNGRRMLVLRDPLRLSQQTVALPQELAPLLSLCDGTRDVSALRAALMVRFGMQVGLSVLQEIVTALDEALLLEGPRFEAAYEEALQAYRTAPCRPPALAGTSYPADPQELRLLLRGYLDVADVTLLSEGGRGLISPHIDFARGGPVYARVWKRATRMVQEARRVILFGTDHAGGAGRITLTRQNYATPFGILPTAVDVVDALAQRLGEEEAFAEELHHRSEHSIELATVWLHALRDGQACELVPVLCGSFSPFISGQASPAADAAFSACVDVLRPIAAEPGTLVVAAADLAHVGPAFGGPPVDLVGRARLQAADDELIAQICAGDAEGFFATLKRTGDQQNVCGLPPIYLALRVLGAVRGERIAYDRCPADSIGTSLVSICGVIFTGSDGSEA